MSADQTPRAPSDAAPPDAPVILVGQPRSGSTLLTRVLNDSPDLFVINDLYVLQEIDAKGLWGPLTPAQAGDIAQAVYARMHTRATQETAKTLEQSIVLGPEALEALRRRADGPWPDGQRWSDVFATMFRAAAEAAGCARWGWNTPQDHLHLARIFSAFPKARAICLLRSPDAVLRSYKNVSGPWHDRRRYNPLTIGLGWRAASRSCDVIDRTHPGRMMFVRYEDLTDATDRTLSEIAGFIRCDLPGADLPALGRNSSLSGDAARVEEVTPTERAAACAVIGAELGRRGYHRPGDARFRWRDAGEMARVTGRSGLFFLRSLLNRNRLMRMYRMARGAFVRR